MVCADETLIDCARRHMRDIVPLQYNLRKGEPKIINEDELYAGMIAAYTGGNIGEVSNSITKVWNSSSPDLDTIKRLCCWNNMVIDYAKTLYKVLPPDDIAAEIATFTKAKVPHFFLYAKDKTEAQIEPLSNSCVDRLSYVIKSYRLDFQKKQLGTFDYRMLMDEPDTVISEEDNELILAYYKLSSCSTYRLVTNDDKDNYAYVYGHIKERLLDIEPDINHLVDVLVEEIFHRRRSKHKAVFWNCFGDIVFGNLKRNIDENTIMCVDCGRRIPKTANRTVCSECYKERQRAANKRYMKVLRAKNVD